jgi:hypothetical protein
MMLIIDLSRHGRFFAFLRLSLSFVLPPVISPPVFIYFSRHAISSPPLHATPPRQHAAFAADFLHFAAFIIFRLFSIAAASDYFHISLLFATLRAISFH